MKKIITLVLVLIVFLSLNINAKTVEEISTNDQIGISGLQENNSFRLSFGSIFKEDDTRFRFVYERNRIYAVPDKEVSQFKEGWYKTNNIAIDIGKNFLNWNNKLMGYGMLGLGLNFGTPAFFNTRAAIGTEVFIHDNISLMVEGQLQGELTPDKIKNYNNCWIGINVNFDNQFKSVSYDSKYEEISDKHPNWSQKKIYAVANGEIDEGLCEKYPDWKVEILKTIENNKIKVGMTPKQVLESWGTPDSKYKSGNYQAWTYEEFNYSTYSSYYHSYTLYFINNKLHHWDEYENN